MVRLASRSTAAAASNIHLSFLVRSRFLSTTHMTIIAQAPSAIAINCLNILSGAEEATTARLRVDKKKAIVSISKAVLPNPLMTATYTHIMIIRPPMAIKTCV